MDDMDDTDKEKKQRLLKPNEADLRDGWRPIASKPAKADEVSDAKPKPVLSIAISKRAPAKKG